MENNKKHVPHIEISTYKPNEYTYNTNSSDSEQRNPYFRSRSKSRSENGGEVNDGSNKADK